MFRKLITYLLIGTYLAMQLLAVPHTHAAGSDSSRHHNAVPHFHFNWLSSRQHHHEFDHSDVAHNHHHSTRTTNAQTPPTDPIPHDADAVYVGDAYVKLSVRVVFNDCHTEIIAIADLSLHSAVPAQADGQRSTHESAENHFADSNLYLILRALRI